MRKQLIAWCNTKIVRLDAEYELFLGSDNRKKRIEGLTTLHHQYKAAPTTLRYLQILRDVSERDYAFLTKYTRHSARYTVLAMILAGDVRNRYFWKYIWDGVLNMCLTGCAVFSALLLFGWVVRHLF